MTRTRRWLVGAAIAAVVLFAGLGVGVRLLLPDDEEFAAEIAASFERATGVALKVGAAHWALRPAPVVEVSELSTAQTPPITVRRILLRPRLSALWRREIAVDAIEVEGAVLPRESVRALRGRWKVGDAPGLLAGPWTLAALPVARVVLRDVTWIDRRKIGLAYDADVVFDPGWRPRTGELSRHGLSPPARLRIERDGDRDRWRTLIAVGGGTWNGHTELRVAEGGRLRLTAELEARDVDIVTLVGSFGRHSAVEGRLHGHTVVDTEGDASSELVRHLHTRTRFKVEPATLDGFDLARTVRTGGAERRGRTPLDALSGTLDTQATEDGVLLRYTDLQARSGMLSASGSATVFNRRLSGEAAVDVVDGVVGVPLRLGGTLDAPELSLTGGALAGAAVGTAVLPGVGTAIGARLGQQVERLFGGGDAKEAAPRPAPGAKGPRPGQRAP